MMKLPAFTEKPLWPKVSARMCVEFYKRLYYDSSLADVLKGKEGGGVTAQNLNTLRIYYHTCASYLSFPMFDCFMLFPWLNAGKDNSLLSSGRGCMAAALAMRSITSSCVTASSLESIMAKASHTLLFMLTRSELTCELELLLQILTH